MSVVVTMWGSVGMFVVYRPLLKYFCLGVLKYVVCCVRDVVDVMGVVFSVGNLRHGSAGARVSEV